MDDRERRIVVERQVVDAAAVERFCMGLEAECLKAARPAIRRMVKVRQERGWTGGIVTVEVRWHP